MKKIIKLSSTRRRSLPFRVMLLVPHTIVGVAVATSVSNPIIAVPLSFLMHYIADRVPHRDFLFNAERKNGFTGWTLLGVLGDLAVGVGIGMYFTLNALWLLNDSSLARNIFLCGVAAALPDFITGIQVSLGDKTPKIVKGLQKIHWNSAEDPSLFFGIFTQVVVVLVSLSLILGSMK